jgi:succinate dehydrogenase/fumarate reductase-like Fe-S protein
MAATASEGVGEILEGSDLRAAGAAHKVALTLKIRRYNPELRGEESWWDEFEIQADPDDRLLDALHQVKWYHDGTLSLRRSCAHGICGSDAMMIDGKNALACKVIVRDVAPKVTVEPIRGLPVLKDLIVDMEPFFAGYRSVLPYLINDSGEPDARGASPVRRHDQVHLVRRVYDLVPDLLGRRGVRRARGDRERPPVRLRLAGRGRQ